jgi:hypothetical protein
MRKMKKESVARSFGTIKGRKVLSHPNSEKSTYWGTTITWIGNMIVINMIANQKFRNRKFSLAKA